MSKRRSRRKRVALIFSGLFVAALLVTVAQVFSLRWHDPASTAWMRMRQRQARAEGRTLEIRHTWTPLAEMPRALRLAVIVAEDGKFFQHRGFDWEAIKAARAVNASRDRIKRGGSTITQQLAKNLFLSGQRSYVRKAREAVITATMELVLPKERILELYLNSIELGPGVFGVSEAARYHFNLPLGSLSTDQCCRLTAIIPAPLRYRVHGGYVTRRAAQLARMISGE